MNATSAHSTLASNSRTDLLAIRRSSSPAGAATPDRQPPAPAFESADVAICDHYSASAPPIAFVEDLLVNGSVRRVALAGVDATLATPIRRVAQLTRSINGFVAFKAGPLLRARMYFAGVDDLYGARQRVLRLRNELIGAANTMNPALVSLGGGCKEIAARAHRSSTSGALLEVDLIVDIAVRSDRHLVEISIERMAALIEKLTNGCRSATTVSDIAERQLLCAHITLDASGFGARHQHADTLAGRIVDLHRLMCAVPGHQGVHNALVLKAANSALTGAAVLGSNSQREWTARADGDTPLAVWYRDSRGRLCGRLALPLVAEPSVSEAPAPSDPDAAAGIHHVHNAVAAIGLAQSLASLHTHANDAIADAELVQHAHDLALMVGARDAEVDALVSRLSCAMDIRFDHAINVLDALRRE